MALAATLPPKLWTPLNGPPPNSVVKSSEQGRRPTAHPRHDSRGGHKDAGARLQHPGHRVRRRKPDPWYPRGTVFRHALDVLRVAGRPLTGREIAEGMMVLPPRSRITMTACACLTGWMQSDWSRRRSRLLAGFTSPPK